MNHNQNKLVRNHVSKHGKDLTRIANEKFGVTNSLILKAINGDKASQEKLGDMGKIGRKLSLAMPNIRDNILDYIEGTSDYNKALADIAKSVGKEAPVIAKAGMDTELANDKYNNLMEEYWASFNNSKEVEKQKHSDAMDVIELQAWVDSLIYEENTKARMETISNRPFLEQRKADEERDNKILQERLQWGSEADLSLIPSKVYSRNPVVRMWNKVREVFE